MSEKFRRDIKHIVQIMHIEAGKQKKKTPEYFLILLSTLDI